VYLATTTDDTALSLVYRKQAQDFYRNTMGLDIPLEKLVCLGGRSETVMEACLDCPFRKCCREREIGQCRDCPDYPCGTIAAYEKTWVNRANQTE
jgi:hypothetical protein